MDPALIEYYNNATGQEFTIAIKIINVTNLYGFDIRFRWNTTFLDYVSHSARIPRDTYPDGVLWNQVLEVKNEVNATAGTYWVAYSSMYPAPSFSGNGTVFTMTLKIKYHPVEPEPTATLKLELYHIELVAEDTSSITYTKEDGTVILYRISFVHDVAVRSVTPSRTRAYYGYGDVYIKVDVKNEGTVSETFPVTAYYNSTAIGTQTVALTPGANKTLTFTMITSSSTRGRYVLSATAGPVSNEVDLTDNTYTDGTITVLIPGDVNADGVVNIADYAGLSAHWYPGPPIGPLGYDRDSDIDGDGFVLITDVGIVSAYWTGPPKGPLAP